MKNFSSDSSAFSNSRKSMGDKTIMSNTGMSLLEDPSETTTLNEKLKLDAYELSQFDPIPPQILRKVASLASFSFLKLGQVTLTNHLVQVHHVRQTKRRAGHKLRSC